jgi:glycosyltransferase involved in cell wall biosynthesis
MKDTLGLVSIIIPVYNRQELIKSAIESALAQTYSDVEVIVVDDGSTDGTPYVLERYANAIKVITQPNCGQSAARNTGLVRCSGEYVLFLDSDDCLEPFAVKTLLVGLKEKEKTSSEWGLAYGKMLTCNESLVPLKNQRKRYYCGDVLLPLLSDNFVRTGTYLVNKSILNAVGGFKEDLAVREDRLLLFFIAARAKFHFIDQYIVRYRRHSGSRARQNPLRSLLQGTQHLDYFFAEAPSPLPSIIMAERPKLYGLLHKELFKTAWRNHLWRETVIHFKAAGMYQKRYFYYPKYIFRAAISSIMYFGSNCKCPRL